MSSLSYTGMYTACILHTDDGTNCKWAYITGPAAGGRLVTVDWLTLTYFMVMASYTPQYFMVHRRQKPFYIHYVDWARYVCDKAALPIYRFRVCGHTAWESDQACHPLAHLKSYLLIYNWVRMNYWGFLWSARYNTITPSSSCLRWRWRIAQAWKDNPPLIIRQSSSNCRRLCSCFISSSSSCAATRGQKQWTPGNACAIKKKTFGARIPPKWTRTSGGLCWNDGLLAATVVWQKTALNATWTL